MLLLLPQLLQLWLRLIHCNLLLLLGALLGVLLLLQLLGALEQLGPQVDILLLQQDQLLQLLVCGIYRLLLLPPLLLLLLVLLQE